MRWRRSPAEHHLSTTTLDVFGEWPSRRHPSKAAHSRRFGKIAAIVLADAISLDMHVRIDRGRPQFKLKIATLTLSAAEFAVRGYVVHANQPCSAAYFSSSHECCFFNGPLWIVKSTTADFHVPEAAPPAAARPDTRVR